MVLCCDFDHPLIGCGVTEEAINDDNRTRQESDKAGLCNVTSDGLIEENHPESRQTGAL